MYAVHVNESVIASCSLQVAAFGRVLFSSFFFVGYFPPIGTRDECCFSFSNDRINFLFSLLGRSARQMLYNEYMYKKTGEGPSPVFAVCILAVSRSTTSLFVVFRDLNKRIHKLLEGESGLLGTRHHYCPPVRLWWFGFVSFWMGMSRSSCVLFLIDRKKKKIPEHKNVGPSIWRFEATSTESPLMSVLELIFFVLTTWKQRLNQWKW